MIDWAILATAATFAQGFLQTAGEGVLSNQGDRTALQLVGKVTNKLRTQIPAENHDLAKAFRRACLVAAQSIFDSRKTTVSGQSGLSPRQSISRLLVGSNPTSLFAEDEGQWLEKANQYLKEQIENLNKDLVYLPERNDADYESLVNPQETNGKVWAQKFSDKLTADMLAELTQAVGAPSEAISQEFEKRWFVQSCNEFQKALSHNPVLANKFQNNVLVRLDTGQQELMQLVLEMFQFLKQSVNFHPNDLPKVVGNFVQRRLFVDREQEQKDLIEWLRQKSKKVIVIKAASGYGKTSLAMEVLHALTPDKQLDPHLDALFIFLCRDNEGTFREVCERIDKRFGKKDHQSLVKRYDAFFIQTQQSPDTLPTEIINDAIDELAQLKNVWLVFDNFETLLTNNQVNNPHLAAFLEKALTIEGLHFLITSQKVPEFKILAEIEELPIGDLPEDFALQFLREEGAKLKTGSGNIDCGLAEISTEDIKKLKEKGFIFVPMSLVALVGYLKAAYRKYGETLTKVLQNEEIFTKFKSHDAKEGSMFLIEKQYLALSDDERLILKAVSIFPQAIEFSILEKILEENVNGETIYSVLTGNTLVRRIGANFYELLPQAKTIITNSSENDDEAITRQILNIRAANYYNSVRKPIKDSYSRKDFTPYLLMIDQYLAARNYDNVVYLLNEDIVKLCALGYMQDIIAWCHLVNGKLNNTELDANNHLNLGVAFYSQGKLGESLSSFDKVIGIHEMLVEAGRADLTNDLATAYMNKGNVFYSQGKLGESISSYEKAIAIREPLVEAGRADLANDLAATYMNKGVLLDMQGELNVAISSFDKVIGIYEMLIEAGREDLTNDLATAYMNKGITLAGQGKFDELISTFNKAIAIHESLVEAGREDLTNDLAKAYMNKGIALNSNRDLENAISFFDKSIKTRDKCLVRGELHILPEYIKCLRLLIRALIGKSDWQRTTIEIIRAFEIGKYLQGYELSEHFENLIKDEQRKIIWLLSEVSEENFKELYLCVGEDSEWIRRLVKEFKK